MVSARAQPIKRANSPFTVANAVTMVGFALGLWWAQGGGPDWAALASIAADEVDGWVARQLSQETALGSLLDWSTDLVLCAAVMRRLGAPWPAIGAVSAGQVWARSEGIAPRWGSVRAVLMAGEILGRRARGSAVEASAMGRTPVMGALPC